MANADKAIKAGVKVAQVYDALTQNAKPAAAVPEQKPPQPQPAQQDPNAVYKVPVGTSPMKGTKTAKVTIIEFSDFQCPFCSRVEPTVAKMESTYGRDVNEGRNRNPPQYHEKARPAAETAMAAAEHGTSWEMHGK